MSNTFNNLTHKALVPFITSGYPTNERCAEYIGAFLRGGADVIELGIPFSDPLADGPVIQTTSFKALKNGATIESTLGLVRRFPEGRFVLMSYLNPLLAYGLPRFFRDAHDAGVAGVIPVDLIPEEADDLLSHAGSVPVSFLVSPTCKPDRLKLIAQRTTGFVYVVSVKGVTGARQGLPEGLSEFIKRVRKACRQPLYVGFGISTPEQAAEVASLADGVVIGSAFLKKMEEGATPEMIESFTTSIRRAMGAHAKTAEARL